MLVIAPVVVLGLAPGRRIRGEGKLRQMRRSGRLGEGCRGVGDEKLAARASCTECTSGTLEDSVLCAV